MKINFSDCYRIVSQTSFVNQAFELILLARLLAKFDETTGERLSIGPRKWSGLSNLKAAANAPFTLSSCTTASFCSGSCEMFVNHVCFSIFVAEMRRRGSKLSIFFNKSFFFCWYTLVKHDFLVRVFSVFIVYSTFASFDTCFQFPSSKFIFDSLIWDNSSSGVLSAFSLNGIFLVLIN